MLGQRTRVERLEAGVRRGDRKARRELIELVRETRRGMLVPKWEAEEGDWEDRLLGRLWRNRQGAA